jgi:sec-independent protein translocase protein TatA
MNSLAFFSMPHGTELLVIAGIALLIFGKNLPQVGRSIGRSIVEFKKGLKGIEDDVAEAERQADRQLEAKDPAKLT